MTVLMLVSVSTTSSAYELNRSSFYAGAGVTFNSFGTGNATGLQIFGGYDLSARINQDISSAIEMGFMDSGDFNNNFFGNNSGAQGVWAALVESVPVGNRVDANIRVGVDFGDDDGLLAGAGMAYRFNDKAALRTEYVVRDNINSFQFNALFHF